MVEHFLNIHAPPLNKGQTFQNEVATARVLLAILTCMTVYFLTRTTESTNYGASRSLRSISILFAKHPFMLRKRVNYLNFVCFLIDKLQLQGKMEIHTVLLFRLYLIFYINLLVNIHLHLLQNLS